MKIGITTWKWVTALVFALAGLAFYFFNVSWESPRIPLVEVPDSR